MDLRQQPSILKDASGANPKLNFLTACLHYEPKDRPPIQVLTKGLHHALHSGKSDFLIQEDNQLS